MNSISSKLWKWFVWINVHIQHENMVFWRLKILKALKFTKYLSSIKNYLSILFTLKSRTSKSLIWSQWKNIQIIDWNIFFFFFKAPYKQKVNKTTKQSLKLFGKTSQVKNYQKNNQGTSRAKLHVSSSIIFFQQLQHSFMKWQHSVVDSQWWTLWSTTRFS